MRESRKARETPKPLLMLHHNRQNMTAETWWENMVEALYSFTSFEIE